MMLHSLLSFAQKTLRTPKHQTIFVSDQRER